MRGGEIDWHGLARTDRDWHGLARTDTDPVDRTLTSHLTPPT
jgi:hypothetical protein